MIFYKQEDVANRLQYLLDQGLLVFKGEYSFVDGTAGILPTYNLIGQERPITPIYYGMDVMTSVGTGACLIVPVKPSWWGISAANNMITASFNQSTVYQSKDDKVIIWVKDMWHKIFR